MLSQRNSRNPTVSIVVAIAVLAAAVELAVPSPPRFTPLGDLPGCGDLSSANAVSADGTVVGGYGSSEEGIEAFIDLDGDGDVDLSELLAHYGEGTP